MPIFQDDLGAGRGTPPAKPEISLSNSPLANVIMRKVSEESIRTELCEGPVPDSLEDHRYSPVGSDASFGLETQPGISNRVELIERLKKGESPTWMPNRNLESLLQNYDQQSPTRKTSSGTSKSSPLLPAAEITKAGRPSSVDTDRLQAGLTIERPRSALHSGDFTPAPLRQEASDHHTLREPDRELYNSERQPWLSTSPPLDFTPFQLDPRFPSVNRPDPDMRTRSRAPSLSSSYSSSFVLKPPTSPLVQSESNEDLEFSSYIDPIDITRGSLKSSRRLTLQASHSIHSTPSVPTSSAFNRPLPHLRRDNTYPYQAHQPRRSLTSNPSLPNSGSSPQTPAFLRSRKPSFTSDSSPLQLASMVGSYEESILRGRMSTTPSKPLDFVAQIGVLGLGKCKSSLRCPAHVTIPFPAVFYSYGTTSHGRTGKSEDGPSPYVGQIDLENSLPNPDEGRDSKRKRHSTTIIERNTTSDIDMLNTPQPSQLLERELRRAEKNKRRSISPRAPPGGSYRIPEKGQLQIIIKNPNKTAVKLFLVPYDLAGMEPGTKTFIRQRSYSAGPIINSALSSLPQVEAPKDFDRLTLRYLVHLHICSPYRGRFYLYKSIRVVFANRVPDGKEKLRNEISLPEPRFSVYRPGRDSSLGFGLVNGAGASLVAEKAYRRSSSGFGLGPSHRAFDAMDGVTQGFPHAQESSNNLVQPIPFSLFRQPVRERTNSDQETLSNQRQSPKSGKSSRPSTSQGSGMSASWNSSSTGIGGYDKLNKGDVGYGGNAFTGSPGGNQGAAEGLLAKRLRCLGVASPSQQDRLDDI